MRFCWFFPKRLFGCANRLATRHREPTKCLVNIITCGGAMLTAPMGSAEEALPQGFPQVNIITLLELLFGLYNKKNRLSPILFFQFYLYFFRRTHTTLEALVHTLRDRLLPLFLYLLHQI